MGIVVCVALLLCVYCVWSLRQTRKKSTLLYRQRGLIAGFALIAGTWNVLWYGLQHLDTFWGQAGIVSGTFLVLGALQILSDKYAAHSPLAKSFGNILFSIRYLTFAGLVLCAILYLVTLIQLNLGMEIIR